MNPKQPCEAFFLTGEGIAFFIQLNHGLIESPVEEESPAANPND
jgi:hypothetical protein